NEAGHRPLNIISSLVWMVRATLTLVSMAAVLFAFQPVLALIIVLVNLPNIYVRFRQGKEQWVINNWSVPEVRMMNYFRRLLTDKVDAKEIRLFGLGDYFLGEHARTFDTFHRRYSLMRRRHWGWNSALAALAGLGMAGAYGYIVLHVAAGTSTLGDLLLYTGALTAVQQNLATLTWQVSSFYQGNLFVRNLFEFLDMPPSMPEPPPGTKPPVPAPLQQGIELRGVAFAYAGSNRNVLEDVTLVIRPGQTVALVGENGAGKTTLVKLLTRLYDPTAGQIFVDGVDLRAYDLESWRRQIAVVFQDFTRFNLPARENIGLGRFEHAEDLMRVQAAAGRGGADTVISRLPDGYDTMLGRRFSGIGHDGVDLSGGEWQKIALSRAFMRAGDVPLSPSPSPSSIPLSPSPSPSMREGNDGSGGAQLLILDEPTAALDARAEHELFLRFNDLTRGKTTLLISHRFSTVRMADHIAVLEDGRITEQGSHQELMARGATYARLYGMQAERYR
ncbi:MAG TPA: ABC transporter ATP-binding protein, partial [Chloroflexota bacterium]|nr:ABC transporter ATP-binding protein [Chloroflexota bacterium]